MESIRFGTDGWRALMNDRFTLDNVRTVAWAIAQHVCCTAGPAAEIVIGHDTRFFAEEFAETCARVCVAAGASVRMAGRPLPTPLVAFAVKHYGCAGAIMLTASHNPYAYNGIKFIPDYAGPATPDITASIEGYLAQAPDPVPLAQGEFLMGECEPYEPYRKHVAGLVDVEALRRGRPRFLVDPMYGAAQGVLSNILVEFGCDVRELHNQRDVMFGGRLPDPSRDGLAEAARLAREEGYALGLGLDGDGDRFGVVDETGAYFGANELIALLAVHLGRERKMEGAIVRTVATTHRLDDIARVLGRDVVETPVGFKYVAEQMLSRTVLIGGEESGGMSVGGHIPEKDGVLANLFAAELYATRQESLSDLLAELDAEFGPRASRRLDLTVDEERKQQLMSELESDPPSQVGPWPVREIRRIDGVKLVLEGDRWVLVRPSGTEALLRVYLEAESQENLSQLASFAEERLA